MKKFKNLIVVLSAVFAFVSCQKEISLETGSTYGGLAVGAIKDTSGNCLPITVAGTYYVGTALTDTHYVSVQVNITTPGNYQIVTDTLNGFYFKDSGFVASTGLQTIRLKAIGTPTSTIQSTFSISFGSGNLSGFCSFTVDAVAGSGVVNPTVPFGDYFPTTTGSNWTYTLNVTTDTLRFTADASTSTVGGNTYTNFVVTTDGERDTLRYRKGAGLYYEYGNIDFLGAFDTVYSNIDFIFLKDNEPSGATWESNEVTAEAGGIVGKSKIKFTIIGKNVNYTINGVSVDSVIRVQRELMFQPTGGSYSVYNTMTMNYAKRRGLLLVEGILPPPFPPAPYRLEALRYQVK